MGVLCSVQRWQAQPLPGAAVPLSCPSASAGRPPAGSTATGPAVRRGPASSRQLLGGSGGAPLMTGSGGAPGPGSGAKPHTSQAPLPRRLRNVQRAHGHFCSSTLSRRIWSRSGLWRGASQMEHWRWPAGFRKVQRAQAHSPTAAMGPGECVWLRARGRGGWCCWVPRLSPHAGLPGPLLPQPAAAGGPGQGSPRGKPWSDSVSAASEEAELPMAPAAARLSAGPGHRVPAAAGEVEHGGGRPREPGSRAPQTRGASSVPEARLGRPRRPAHNLFSEGGRALCRRRAAPTASRSEWRSRQARRPGPARAAPCAASVA